MTWQLIETPVRAMADYIDGAQVAKFEDVQDRAEYAGDLYAELAPFVALRHEFQDTPEAGFPVLYLRPMRSRITVGPAGLRKGFIGTHDYVFIAVCWTTAGPEMALAMAERYMVGVLEMIAEYFSTADGRTVEWAMGNDPEVHYERYSGQQPGEYFGEAWLTISAQIAEGAL